nr:hypothetical protein [Tanacetum cinerariifolium]
MLATRGSGKVTTVEALSNNKTKSIRWLEHALPSQATRKAMLEIYHCVTSASFTTPANVRQNVAIASGFVIKLEIIGVTPLKLDSGGKATLWCDFKAQIDPPKRTLIPRVQLATAADEEVAKREGDTWILVKV